MDHAKSTTLIYSDVFTTKGSSGLMLAAAQGNLEEIARLMDSEALVTRSTRWTALMEAAYYGRLQAVLMLMPLLAGGQLASEDGMFSRGSTALIVAATLGHKECVLALLEAEKDVSRWSDDFCRLFRGENILLTADPDSAGRSTLMYYAMHSSKNIFASSIHRSAASLPLGHVDFLGYSALMHAVRTDNIDFIVYILQDGLQELGIISVYSRRYSALMMAAEQGKLEICELLASEEAGLCNPYGLCALDIAIINGHYDIVLLLASAESHIAIHKACTYIHDLQPGMMPCDIARKFGTPEMVALLSQRGRPALTLSSLTISKSFHPESAALLKPVVPQASSMYRSSMAQSTYTKHLVVDMSVEADDRDNDVTNDADNAQYIQDGPSVLATASTTVASLPTVTDNCACNVERLKAEISSLSDVNSSLKQKLERIDREYQRTKLDLQALQSSIKKQANQEQPSCDKNLEATLQTTKKQLKRSMEYSQEIYEANVALQNKLQRAKDALILLKNERKDVDRYDSALVQECTVLKKELHHLKVAASGLQLKESTMATLIQRFTRFYGELERITRISWANSPRLSKDTTDPHPPLRNSEENDGMDIANESYITEILNKLVDESFEEVPLVESGEFAIVQ